MEPGTRVGDWIVRGRLGAGAMGEVHLVEHATRGFSAQVVTTLVVSPR